MSSNIIIIINNKKKQMMKKILLLLLLLLSSPYLFTSSLLLLHSIKQHKISCVSGCRKYDCSCRGESILASTDTGNNSPNTTNTILRIFYTLKIMLKMYIIT